MQISRVSRGTISLINFLPILPVPKILLSRNYIMNALKYLFLKLINFSRTDNGYIKLWEKLKWEKISSASWIHFGSDLREAQVNTKWIWCNLRFARDAFLFRVHRRLIRGFTLLQWYILLFSFHFVKHDLYVRGWKSQFFGRMSRRTMTDDLFYSFISDTIVMDYSRFSPFLFQLKLQIPLETLYAKDPCITAAVN